MKRRRVALSGALLIVCLVLAAFVAPAANAHVKSFNATLTLQYKSQTQTFFGTLGTNRVCKGDRLVTLYDADTDTPVATTTTKDNGQYRISFVADGGPYYTRVEEEVRGGYGHVHTCEGDQSRTIDTSKGKGRGPGVLGNVGSGSESGSESDGVLPFTGSELTLFVLIGAVAIGAGVLTLKTVKTRRGRATTVRPAQPAHRVQVKTKGLR